MRARGTFDSQIFPQASVRLPERSMKVLLPVNAWHFAGRHGRALMNPATYHMVHLILTLVLAVSGLASWRIYFRYARAHRPETSAWVMMKRLRSEGNPDGTWMLVESVVGIAAGIGLLVLIYVR